MTKRSRLVSAAISEAVDRSYRTLPRLRWRDSDRRCAARPVGAANHPGFGSFDGEIARFLIYDRSMSDAELVRTFEALRKDYFGPPLKLNSRKTGPTRAISAAEWNGFDLMGRETGKRPDPYRFRP